MELELKVQGPHAFVEVRDRGPGVPAGQLEGLFGRFGGERHGLAIVQRVALAHGGVVSMSNRPGGGAIFTLRLPVLA